MKMDKIFIFMAKFIKKHTNFMVWWENNLDKVINENNKIIIIFWHPLCIPCQKIMLLMPVIYVYYTIKWYKLKFCNVKENCQECERSFIKTTPTLIVYEKSIEKIKLEDEEVMKKLFKVV